MSEVPGVGGEESRNPLRRAFWLGVVLGIGIAGAGLLNFGLPYVLLRSGIGSGYEIGFLRWGTAEYHRRFGSDARARRDVVGWAWGGGGEELRIDYDVTTEEGVGTLVVDRAISLEDVVWSQRFAANGGGIGAVAIEPPETNLYQIRFVRRGFHGRAKVTWGF